jgi:hypothetical protein
VIFDRLRRRLEWDGTIGRPRSTNGASSFHLSWVIPAGTWVEVEAVLEIVESPRVPDLSFWALQASFVDRGRDGGAAHLGLQWHQPHPGSTAVNWGGYAPGGRELEGSPSPLVSAPGNVNTRDFAWVAARPYRLRIAPGGSTPPPGLHPWRGEVTDLSTGVVTVVRDLWTTGDRLTAPVVWSEIFARCDDPGAAVRWSGLRLRDEHGTSHDVAEVSVNYQARADGGCATTDVRADAVGIVQATGVRRVTPQGARLTVPPSPPSPPSPLFLRRWVADSGDLAPQERSGVWGDEPRHPPEGGPESPSG